MRRIRVTDLLTILQASAHDLQGVADASVQTIVTSLPYFNLREYKGEQDVLWPRITFIPMAGLPALTVPGCAPDCVHEWGERVVVADVREQVQNAKTRTTTRYYGDPSRQFDGNHQKHSVRQYCVHCGGWKGGLGLEPTPEMYTAHVVLCAREWRRVLRPDGTLWLNLSDSYASDSTYNAKQSMATAGGWKQAGVGPNAGVPAGLKVKDRIGIPWRVAFALQADGWYLRDHLPWVRRNAMPGSQDDRPTATNEDIFLFSKSDRYFYDQEAVKLVSTKQFGAAAEFKRATKDHVIPRQTTAQHRLARTASASDPLMRYRRQSDWFMESLAAILDGEQGLLQTPTGDPLALVVNTAGYKAAHYAVFPPRLVAPMVLASTSARGKCPTCGAPWRRVLERTDEVNPAFTGSPVDTGKTAEHQLGRMQAGRRVLKRTIGWWPTCGCYGLPELPAIPEEPELSAEEVATVVGGAPTVCARCQGAGELTAGPLFPDASEVCPDCKGARGTPASADWLAWENTWLAWYAAYQAVMDEVHVLLAQVTETMPTAPCVVLDPCAGTGTVARVAAEHGREAIAADISWTYLEEHVPARTKVQQRFADV